MKNGVLTWDLFAMVIASLIAGYWAMGLLVQANDRSFEFNRVYSTLTMTIAMLLSYFLFTGHWMAASILVLPTILIAYMWNKQAAVGNTQFLKSMIEHHSMAITMSSAQLKKSQDPRILGLAGKIIKNQTAEIELMKTWISS